MDVTLSRTEQGLHVSVDSSEPDGRVLNGAETLIHGIGSDGAALSVTPSPYSRFISKKECCPVIVSETDHLVVTAGSLSDGVAFVEQALGVTMQPGGKHVRMSTHNALLKIGAGLYLEVIAADPEAPFPNRPRWFQLDERNADERQSLATWVVRTNNIQEAEPFFLPGTGKIEFMERGSLRWMISIPADGRLAAGGVAPSMIQWLTEPHPASRLPESGVSLIRLEGFHPQPEFIEQMLTRISFQGQFQLTKIPAGQPSGLRAIFRTVEGLRELSSTGLFPD
jgi:hypothetical protein